MHFNSFWMHTICAIEENKEVGSHNALVNVFLLLLKVAAQDSDNFRTGYKMDRLHYFGNIFHVRVMIVSTSSCRNWKQLECEP